MNTYKYEEMLKYITFDLTDKKQTFLNRGAFKMLEKENEKIEHSVAQAGQDRLTEDFVNAESYINDKIRIGRNTIFMAESGFMLLPDIEDVFIATQDSKPGEQRFNTYLWAKGKKKNSWNVLCSYSTDEVKPHMDEYYAARDAIKNRLGIRENGSDQIGKLIIEFDEFAELGGFDKPFSVILNGQDIGIVKSGDKLMCNVGAGIFELQLVPKISRLFGWKTNVISAKCTSENAKIEVRYSYLTEPCKKYQQLHIERKTNVEIISETIK